MTGIGLAGDADAVNHWDLGVADGTGLLSPTNSVLPDAPPAASREPDATSSLDPEVVATYDTSVAFSAWRTNPAFVGAILVAVDLPPNLMGDYHLAATGSPALTPGRVKTSGRDVDAPALDIDDEPRPAGAASTPAPTSSAPPAPPPPSAPPASSRARAADTGRARCLQPANANDLSGSWSQLLNSIRVNGNQAVNTSVILPGQAIRTAGATFGNKQGAAFTFVNPRPPKRA